MKIILTGISGFVGTYLSYLLLKNNYYVIGIDKVNPNHNSFHKFYNHDLCKKISSNFIKEFPQDIDILIHCAAAKGDFDLTDYDFKKDNVLASENTISLLEKLKIKNVIHYSTVSVYGHNNSIKTENAILNPNNSYGKTKLTSEKRFQNWFSKKEEFSKNLTILRPSVIYGVNNFANMFNLLKQLYKKIPITIGNGKYVKSMIALENIVDITLFSINNLKGLQIYNCTDEPYPTLDEVFKIISKVDGFHEPLIKIPYVMALFFALPFELLTFITGKDYGINRDRVYKFSTPTDFRSDLLRKRGYIQKYKTEDCLVKMAEWFKLKINE